jgi:hypothetical protein
MGRIVSEVRHRTRQRIALDIQDACNPVAVCIELAEQITLFSRTAEYHGTQSICEDPALRAITYKVADLFRVSNWNAWDEIAKALEP